MASICMKDTEYILNQKNNISGLIQYSFSSMTNNDQLTTSANRNHLSYEPNTVVRAEYIFFLQTI